MRCSESEKYICEEMGSGALVVDVETGRRWVLNAAAVALWKLDGAVGLVERFQTSEMFQLAPGGGVEFRELNLGTGPRRRPSPRGNSGPG